MFVTQHWWFARFLFISVLYLNFFFWSVSMHSSCAKNIHKSYMHSSFFCLILPCIYVMMPKFYRSNVPVHPEYYSDFTVHISNWFLIMFYQTFCKLFFLCSSPHGCILLTIEVAIYFFRELFILFVSYYVVPLYGVFFKMQIQATKK